MNKRNLLQTALAASIGIGASNVSAVTQGSIGATSTGEIDVLLVLDKVIQISALDDLDFGNVTPDPLSTEITATEDFCVYSNDETPTYEITATTTEGSGGAFAMTHATLTDEIPYTLELDDGSTGDVLLSSAAITSSDFTADAASFDCSSGTNATLTATVQTSDIESSAAGSYSDTLTLLVTPD